MTHTGFTSANSYLFVSYDELDDWTKQQDLDVFKAVLDEINKKKEAYKVEREDGLPKIDSLAVEQAVLDGLDEQK